MANHRFSTRVAGALALVCAAAAAEAHTGWGIASTPDGRLYVTDVARRIVWRIEPDGRVEPALEGVHAHALVTIADGSVYGADAGAEAPFGHVWRIDADGRVHTLVAAGAGGPLGFESFLIDTDGTIYSAGRVEPPELFRRSPDGTVVSVAREFTSVRGMAWAPDGGVLLTDGPFLKYVAHDGTVETLGGIAFTEPPWQADLAGVTTDGSGGAFVADVTGGRVLNVGRRSGVVVEYASSFPWSASGVVRDADGLAVLEPLAATWSLLADLQVGPYLRVRRLGVDGRVVTLAVLWGARTWMAAAAVALAAAAGVAWHIRRYRSGY